MTEEEKDGGVKIANIKGWTYSHLLSVKASDNFKN